MLLSMHQNTLPICIMHYHSTSMYYHHAKQYGQLAIYILMHAFRYHSHACMQVSVQSGKTGLPCVDAYSNASLSLVFSATMPAPTGTSGGNTSLLTLSSMATLVSGSYSTGSLTSWQAVDIALEKTYALMGVNISPLISLLPPLYTLQPVILAQAQSPTNRALGVAMMACESQVTSFLALGAELIISALPDLSGGVSAAVNYLSKELVTQAEQQPFPTSASLLTNIPFVTSVLMAALQSAGSSDVSQVNMTANVITSIAGTAETYRFPAVQIMQGTPTAGGLNVLSAFTAVGQIPAVQAQASAAVHMSVITGSTQYLLPFLPASLTYLLQQVSLLMA